MTANTGSLTPEAPVEKQGFISKVQKGAGKLGRDVRNAASGLLMGATALTAPTTVGVGVATTAALSENAEAANVIVQLNGLPTSTVSQPVKVSGLATPTTTTIQYNSQLLYSTPVAGTDTTIDRITVNLSAADIGSGGSLTFTFRLSAGTDSITSSNNGKGIVGTQYQVRQELRFGPAGGPSDVIDFLDSGVRTNDITDEYFSNAEAWRADSGIVSYTIPNFTQPGEYHLDNALFVQNSTGVDRLRGTTISFSPIPEPTAPLLVGIAGTLGLLRRKRNNTDTTKNSAS